MGDQSFVLPAELEPWREEIEAECGGGSVEVLLNDHTTNGFNNAIKAALICMCETKLHLIARLHKTGQLVDPAARKQRDEELRERLEARVTQILEVLAGALGEDEELPAENLLKELDSIFEEADDG